MARPSSSGMEYMIRPEKSGPYVYGRSLRPELVPFFHGQLDLEWTVSARMLSALSVVKVSLKTGDEKTARLRWGIVHVQIETFIEAARKSVRETAMEAETRKRLKKIDGLSGNEIVTIAGQVRHDVLAADDRAWEGPEEMAPVAQLMAKILKQNNPGKADPDGRALLANQILEQRIVKAALKSRELGQLDQDLTVQQVSNGDKHVHQRALADGEAEHIGKHLLQPLV